MMIQDTRYTGIQTESENMSYKYEEQESTFSYCYNDDMITVYSSIQKDITKLLKLCNHNKVDVISVNDNGKITAIKCYITRKQLSLRKEIELTEEQKRERAERFIKQLNQTNN